jgi:serine/threonine protein kinase
LGPNHDIPEFDPYGAINNREPDLNGNMQESSEELPPLNPGLMCDLIEGAEDIRLYRAGGRCPIHINQQLHNGRFTIVHKLGYGGFSTVWLARDNAQEKYVAIRISTAENFDEEKKIEAIHDLLKEQSQANPVAQYICLPLEHFVAESPNGKHQCSVFPFCGPSIAQISEANNNIRQDELMARFTSEEAQRGGLQAMQVLAFLHSPEVGVGHGDISSGNVVLDIGNLDHLSTEQLWEVVGHPKKFPMSLASGEPLPSSAPDYVVDQIDPLKLFSYRTGNIKIIDFGSSYMLNKPPASLGIPFMYRTPEHLLHNKIGKEGDIWALICVIWELRCGGWLFGGFMSGYDIEVLRTMKATLMRPFPRQLLNEEGIEDGLDQPCFPDDESSEWSLRDRLESFTKTVRQPYRPEVDYAFQIEYSKGFSKLWNCVKWVASWRPWEMKGELKMATMSDDELEVFLDLVNRSTVYEVEKRPSIVQMLSHPWFSKAFAKPSLEEWTPSDETE